tara:strand:+ start:34 stop:483 length:450 start_codon:yes stop_codon:yes gene_type:complete
MSNLLIEQDTETIALINNSPYSRRLKKLLKNPEIGTEPFMPPMGMENKSNCHGTTFYIIGKYTGRRPVLLYKEDMIEYLDILDKVKPKENTIASFWLEDSSLAHTALYIGEAYDKKVIVHQPDTEEEFSIDHLIHWNDEYPHVFFHQPK